MTITSKAVEGPILTTLIVHSTLSPTRTDEALTILLMIKSQIGLATVVLLASLLVLFDSWVVVFTTTILVLVPFVKILVTKTRETGLFGLKSPISQILVFSSKLPSEGGLKLVISTPSGRKSLTLTFEAVLGPTLITVMVHSTESLT